MRSRTALFPACLAGLLLASGVAAAPRTYLSVNGGVDVLNTNLNGDVVDNRVIGQIEMGIGSHLNDDFLLEGTFGFLGSQRQSGRVLPISIDEIDLPVHLRAYRLDVNPIMLRLRWAGSGMRKGYVKPELSVGAGLYSVSRWLRPLPFIEPEVTSDLLGAFEVGASALFIFGPNWMGYLGPRYTFTQRTDLVDDTDHLDGLSLLIGFRFFLNSPRDEFEPDP